MSAYSDAVLAHSPLLYWRLGESSGTSAVDASGNGYAGTIESSVALGTTGLISGDADTAMTFNGTTNSRVTRAHASALNISAGTVIAWLKTTQSTTARIFVKATEYDLLLYGGKFAIYDTVGSAVRDSGVTINDNGVHMVVMAFDSGVASGTGLYVDGVHAANVTYTAQNNSFALAVGGNATNTTSRFVGVIDEVALIPSKLTAGEISDLYDIGTGGGGGGGGSVSRAFIVG